MNRCAGSMLVLMACASAPQLWAQPPVATFEIASVRMTPPGGNGLTSISPPGSATFSAMHVSLPILISIAYGVDSDRVTGGPSWVGSQQYDVNAKAEGDRRLSYEELKAPLQKLLEERFQLVVKRQTKEGPGYALVVAKSGSKLKRTEGGAAHSYILKGGLDLQNAPLDGFAGALSRPAGRPVVNETGIKDNYDIKLQYAPEGAVNSPLPSIFTALQEQLGLQLVPRKVPVEMVVIERVERVPADN
jgi:uncharacterized protein (TIGR03435 family)